MELKELFEGIQAKLVNQPRFSVRFKDGGILGDDAIIIDIEDTQKFTITKKMFSNGFDVIYRNHYNNMIDMEVNDDEYGIELFELIETLMLGEEVQAQMYVEEMERDLRVYKTPQEIFEAHDENEGSNNADANALLLAMNFGSEKDVEDVKKKMFDNYLAGYSVNDTYDIYSKLYPKFKKHTAEVEETEAE